MTDPENRHYYECEAQFADDFFDVLAEVEDIGDDDGWEVRSFTNADGSPLPEDVHRQLMADEKFKDDIIEALVDNPPEPYFEDFDPGAEADKKEIRARFGN